MRCPKCGYHSFDTLEACKKCNNDLSDFKAKFSLRSLLFPGQTQAAPAAGHLEAAGLDLEAPLDEELTVTEEGGEFGFDFMGEEDGKQPSPPTPPLPAAAAFEDAAGEEQDAFSLDGDAEEEPLDFNSDWEQTSGSDEEIPELAAAEEEEPFSFDQPWDEVTTDAPAEAFAEEEPGDFAADEEALSFAAEADSLPALEDQATVDFSAGDELPALDAEADTSDWNPFAEPPEEPAEAQKKGLGEEPSAPFDFRGSASAGRAPESPAVADHADPDEDDASLASVFLSSLGEEPEDEPEHQAFDFQDNEPEEGLTPELETPAAARVFSAQEGLPEPLSAEYTVEAEPSSKAAEQQTLFAWQETEQETAPEAAEPATEESSAAADATAPLALRLGAVTVDLLILALIFVLFLVAGEMAMSRGPGSELLPPAEILLELAVPYFLVLFAVCFGYFTLFHFLAGQTVGKMFLRLRVEGEDGSPLSFSQAFLHSSGGLLCLLTAGIGFAAAGLHPQRQGWNDRLAATRVVRTNQ